MVLSRPTLFLAKNIDLSEMLYHIPDRSINCKDAIMQVLFEQTEANEAQNQAFCLSQSAHKSVLLRQIVAERTS